MKIEVVKLKIEFPNVKSVSTLETYKSKASSLEWLLYLTRSVAPLRKLESKLTLSQPFCVYIRVCQQDTHYTVETYAIAYAHTRVGDRKKGARISFLFFFPLPSSSPPSSRRRSRTSIHTARKHSRYVPTNSNRVCFTIGLFAADSWAASKMTDVLPTPIFYSTLHSILFSLFLASYAASCRQSSSDISFIFDALESGEQIPALDPGAESYLYFRYGSVIYN